MGERINFVVRHIVCILVLSFTTRIAIIIEPCFRIITCMLES